VRRGLLSPFLFVALFLAPLSLGAFGVASAQGQPGTQPAGTRPAAVADAAVREWLGREPLNPLALSGLEPEEICRQLPTLIENPAPPAGTTVNFADRVERDPLPGGTETGTGTNTENSEGDGAETAPEAAPETAANTRRYTYPVTFPGDRLGVLEVTLKGDEGRWQAERVGPQQTLQTPSIPTVLQTPAAAWIFGALSLVFLYGLIRPSFFRRWLAEGWGYVREHRRLTIGTVVVLYGLFGLGVLTGANLPPECAQTITQLVEQGVSQLGAAQAYESGNVARAAVVTLYQNFVMGAVVTTYGFAFISFGLLAYLVNGLRFLALGLPFGFLTQADPVTLVTVLILIIVELMAYVLVTAGGGMLLATLVRQGFGGFRLALRKLTMMLPLAFLLLVIGAWYEAAVIILPRLFAGS